MSAKGAAVGQGLPTASWRMKGSESNQSSKSKSTVPAAALLEHKKAGTDIGDIALFAMRELVVEHEDKMVHLNEALNADRDRRHKSLEMRANMRPLSAKSSRLQGRRSSLKEVMDNAVDHFPSTPVTASPKNFIPARAPGDGDGDSPDKDNNDNAGDGDNEGPSKRHPKENKLVGQNTYHLKKKNVLHSAPSPKLHLNKKKMLGAKPDVIVNVADDGGGNLTRKNFQPIQPSSPSPSPLPSIDAPPSGDNATTVTIKTKKKKTSFHLVHKNKNKNDDVQVDVADGDGDTTLKKKHRGINLIRKNFHGDDVDAITDRANLKLKLQPIHDVPSPGDDATTAKPKKKTSFHLVHKKKKNKTKDKQEERD